MFDVKNYSLWTALITPMKANGEIHFNDLEKLLKRQEAAGVGVVLLGSTGEGLALDDEEKRSVLTFASNLNLKVPLMSGLGGFNLKQNLKFIEFVETLKNIHGYLMVTPLYAKPGVVGQTEWFKALMDKANKPCMLYNVPSRTGVTLPFETVKNLVNHKNFWAIKEASGSVVEFEKYRQAAPNKMLYSGDDSMTPYFALSGSKGLVSVAGNVWPSEVLSFVKTCLNSNAQKVSEMMPVWNSAIKSLFTAANPTCPKVLLHKLGVIETSTLRAPLTNNEPVNIEELIQNHKQITEWGKSHG